MRESICEVMIIINEVIIIIVIVNVIDKKRSEEGRGWMEEV